MKTKSIALLAAVSFLPLTGFAQTTPPTPPAPAVAPIPPVPPNSRDHDHDRERLPKVPVTYLGVETSEVPSVVAEQLGLAKGFGLVVDYVVPDGPAAAAGVQANDILKMFNDQILTEPDQLAKLVRSNAEGASVSLTVMRKGAETKLTVKLGKRDVSQRGNMRFDRHGGGRHGENFGMDSNFDEQMRQFGEEMGRRGEEIGQQIRDQAGTMQFGMVGDAVGRAREEAQRVRDEMRRSIEEGKRAAREGMRAAEEGRRVSVISRNDGTMKSTRIDLGKAQIVYNDAQGEMKIETVDNKKMLTAKDPQGRLLFSGPISNKEELDKVPAEVRQRYEKLEQKDLPAVGPQIRSEDNEADDDNDADDADGDDNDSDTGGADVLQVTGHPAHSFPNGRLGIHVVLI